MHWAACSLAQLCYFHVAGRCSWPSSFFLWQNVYLFALNVSYLGFVICNSNLALLSFMDHMEEQMSVNVEREISALVGLLAELSPGELLFSLLFLYQRHTRRQPCLLLLCHISWTVFCVTFLSSCMVTNSLILSFLKSVFNFSCHQLPVLEGKYANNLK